MAVDVPAIMKNRRRGSVIVQMPDGEYVKYPKSTKAETIRQDILRLFPEEGIKAKRRVELATKYPKHAERILRGDLDLLEAAKIVGQDIGEAVVDPFVQTKNVKEGTADPTDPDTFGPLALMGVPLRAVRNYRPVRPQSFGGTPEQVVEAGRFLGIDTPGIVATSNKLARTVGTALEGVPVVGTPIARAIEGSVSDIAQRTAQVAARASGSVPTRESIGVKIKEVARKWIDTDSVTINDQTFDMVRNSFQNPQATTVLRNTALVYRDVLQRRRAGKVPLETSGTKAVKAAIFSGGMTYDGLLTLKRHLQSLSTTAKRQGLPSDDIKQLLGAINKDLRSAAFVSGGTRGLRIHDQAVKVSQEVAKKRVALERVAGLSTGESVVDAVVRMASSKGGGDIGRLRYIMRTLSRQEREELLASFVDRIGRTIPDDISSFNPAKFVTQYQSLSPMGKKLLVDNPATKNALDSILRHAERLERLGATSKVGRTDKIRASVFSFIGAAGSAGGAVAEFYLLGQFPWVTLSTAAGMRTLAWGLSRPTTARSIAMWTKSYAAFIEAPTATTARAFRRQTAITAAKLVAESGGEMFEGQTNTPNTMLDTGVPTTGRPAPIPSEPTPAQRPNLRTLPESEIPRLRSIMGLNPGGA